MIANSANPFVGPRPFTAGEQLYGRDRENLDLLDLLIAERIVLLYSPSGAGKTSLVQAGLVPRLQSEGFRVLRVIRVNAEPPKSAIPNRYLFSALRSLDEVLSDEELAVLDLDGYLKRLPRRPGDPDNDVLIFDQFEEILTVDPTNRAAKDRFFAEVGAALRDRSRWALFSMREDYLAGLDPYLRPVPTRLSNTFRLDLLGVDEACLAMQEPSRHAGVDFTDAAARKLVDNLRLVRVQRPDGAMEDQLGQHIEPVQLQVVCRRLWERLDGASQIVEKDIEALGDIDRSLAEYYAEQVAATAAKTGVPERAIRDWFEHQLITQQGIRGQVLKGQGLAVSAVQTLEDAHVVRSESRRGASWCELAHDRLIEPVRTNNAAWRDAHLNPVQKSASLWEAQGRPAGLLLSDAQLAAAQRWAREQGGLTEVEQRFLAASAEAQRAVEKEQRQARRIRWLAIASTIFGVVALIAGAMAWNKSKESQKEEHKAKESAAQAAILAKQAKWESWLADGQRILADKSSKKAEERRQEAELQTKIAQSRQLAAQALSHVTDGLDLALLLSIEAYRARPTVEARNALLTGLEYQPRLRALLQGSRREASNDLVHEMIQHLTFSLDGKKVAATTRHSLKIWDVMTHELSSRPVEIPSAWDLALSPNFAMLAVSTEQGINIHDVTGRPLFPLSAQTLPTSGSMAFSPNGKILAAGTNGDSLYFWDVSTRQPLGGRIDSPSYELIFSPHGNTLAARAAEVVMWDVATRQRLHVRLPTYGIQKLAFSHDGNKLAVIARDGTLHLWDLIHGEDGTPIPRSDKELVEVAFSPDGSTLAGAYRDGSIGLWDTSSGQRLDPSLNQGVYTNFYYPRVGLRTGVSALAFSPDGKTLVSGAYDGGVVLWAVTEPHVLARILEHQTGGSGTVAFSPNGTVLASGLEGEIALWDVATGKPRGNHLRTGANHMLSFAFSPDGRTLASGNAGETVILWDPVTGRQVGGPMQAFARGFSSVAFSANGKMLLAGSLDGAIEMWDIATQKRIAGYGSTTITSDYYYPTMISNILFSRDGKTIITNRGLWDVTTQRRLEGQSGPLDGVALTRDGKTLASDSGQGIVLWDFDSRQRIGELSKASPPVAFSPDGKTLTSTASTGLVLWDIPSQQQLGLRLDIYDGVPSSVAFSPDGKTLAANYSHLLVLWDIDSDSWRTKACNAASRNLTRDEWRHYMTNEPYRKTCPDLP